MDGASSAMAEATKEQLPLPAIAKQYEAIKQLFPRDSGEDKEDFRGYRKLIGSFAAADGNVIRNNLMDNPELDLFEADDLMGRMRVNRAIMVTATRFLLESLDTETPAELHFGRTIYGQFLENLEKVGLSETRTKDLISKAELYGAWNDFAERYDLPPVSFSDTKLAKDEVEEVFDVDTSRDTPEGADSEAYVFSQ